jgi:hypothetical protein
MTYHVNDNGTWKEPVPYVNDNGTWKEPDKGYVNDNGTWKEVYSARDNLMFCSCEMYDGTGVYGAVKIIEEDDDSVNYYVSGYDKDYNYDIYDMDWSSSEEVMYFSGNGRDFGKLSLVSDYSEIDLPSGWGRSLAVDEASEYVYVSTDSGTAMLYEYELGDVNDFTGNSLSLDAGKIRMGKDGYLYAVDDANDRIVKIDVLSFTIEDTFDSTETYEDFEAGICYGADGYVYVYADGYNASNSQYILKIDPTDMSVTDTRSVNLNACKDIQYGVTGHLYVHSYDKILKYDPSDMSFIDSVNESMSDFELGMDGNVYVGSENTTLVVYDSDLTLLWSHEFDADDEPELDVECVGKSISKVAFLDYCAVL